MKVATKHQREHDKREMVPGVEVEVLDDDGQDPYQR